MHQRSTITQPDGTKAVIYRGALYADVREADTIYRDGIWHRVLTIQNSSTSNLVFTLAPVDPIDPAEGTSAAYRVTMPANAYLMHEVYRPIGCLDSIRAKSLHRVLLADWGDLDQMLHAVQVRMVANWDRVNIGGRNWLTIQQASGLYDSMHTNRDLDWSQALRNHGITVIHPPQIPNTDPDLQAAADQLTLVIDTLQTHQTSDTPLPVATMPALLDTLCSVLAQVAQSSLRHAPGDDSGAAS
jgi:hypothetical protein